MNDSLLYRLYAQGTMSKDRFDELQSTIADKKVSALFYISMGLGITFLVAGLLFFIAANWADITPLAKLIGIEIILIASMITAFYLRDSSRLFHLFVMTSAILVGLNLAIYGQVYQTGADAYTLFSTWTLLITLWAWFLRLPYLFMVWQGLLYLSLILFFNQYLSPFERITEETFQHLLISLSHILLLVAIFKNKLTIFQNRPNQIMLLIIALLTVLFPAMDTVFKSGTYSFTIIAFIQTAVLLYYFHQKRLIVEMGLIGLNVLLFVESMLLQKLIKFSSIESFLLFGLITLGLTFALGKSLKALHKSYKEALL